LATAEEIKANQNFVQKNTGQSAEDYAKASIQGAISSGADVTQQKYKDWLSNTNAKYGLNLSYETTPTSTTPASTPAPTTSTSDMINQQSQAALAAKAAALAKARDTAVNGYNQQVDALPGQYQPLRNQASLQGEQNSRAITEQQASQGNWRSGANQTAQTANGASTANQIGGYNLQQQDAVNKLKQAIAQTQADYGYNMAGATADTESQRLAALISQSNTDKGLGMQQQQIDNQTSQFAQTLGMSQQQLAAQIAQNGVQNAFNTAQLNQQANQFAQSLGLSRDQFNASMSQWAQTFAAGQAQNTFNNGIAEGTLTGWYNGIHYVKGVADTSASGPVTSTTTTPLVTSTSTTGSPVYYLPTKPTTPTYNSPTSTSAGGPRGDGGGK